MTKINAVAFEVTEYADLKKPGAYRFTSLYGDKTNEACGINFGCPCGCGQIGGVFFKGKGRGLGGEWEVSGEWPKATLEPSIGFNSGDPNSPKGADGYHWHGYLRNGVFEQC